MNHTLRGGLGSGKSIIATGRIRHFMMQGRKVAGNMDLYLDKLLPPFNKTTYLRLSDFPTSEDLWNLGKASDSKNEDTFGLLVLDELAVFLNSREWATKGRDQFIKYLRHVRKQHWHTLFITQDIESIDKQARVALIEHTATCSRTDRLPIPIIGWLLKMFGIASMLPKVHIAIVKYGMSEKAHKVDTWTYYGKSLYGAYDTDQIFQDAEERPLNLYGYQIIPKKTKFLGFTVGIKQHKQKIVYPATCNGQYTMLSAWHLKGRYISKFEAYFPYLLVSFILTALSISFLLYLFMPKPVLNEHIQHQLIQQQQNLTNTIGSPVESYYFDGSAYHLKLADNTYSKAYEQHAHSINQIYFQVDNVKHVYTNFNQQ